MWFGRLPVLRSSCKRWAVPVQRGKWAAVGDQVLEGRKLPNYHRGWAPPEPAALLVCACLKELIVKISCGFNILSTLLLRS